MTTPLSSKLIVGIVGRPRALERLLEKHQTECLWVQYSAYGFGYQGLPWHLSRAIGALRSRPQIVVYFHETHCLPHQLNWKGFLVSPLQKQIAKSIANHADVIFTSTDVYARRIREDYGAATERVNLLPLGSNIPISAFTDSDRTELRKQLGFSPQDRVAVIFGSVDNQRRALRKNQAALGAAVKNYLVNRIVCLGGNPGTSRDAVLRDMDIAEPLIDIMTVAGHQPAQRVAEILIASDVGVLGYPFERFGKSGAFMAYSLAGLPVLIGNDIPIRINNFLAVKFVRSSEPKQFAEIVDDTELRIRRHREANASFSWSSLAHQALTVIKRAREFVAEPRLTEKAAV
jgi:hypothetical protein